MLMVFKIHLLLLLPLLEVHVRQLLWIKEINWFVAQRMLVLSTIGVVPLFQTMDSYCIDYFQGCVVTIV
jgi:hypothetical protein